MWSSCACRRIVAIDAIVRIDGDEYRALSVEREVLQERAAFHVATVVVSIGAKLPPS